MKTAKFIALFLVAALALSGCTQAAEPAETTAAAAEAATEAVEAVVVETKEAAATETPAAEKAEDAFTPSVSQKGAPAVSGELVIWDRVDEKVDLLQDKDKAVMEVPADKLTLTAFADRANAGEDVKTALENAYQQIVYAKSLTEVAADLEEALKETGLKAEQLVVRDLVDITLDPEYEKTLEEEPNYIALTFEMDLQEGETLIVLHNVEGDQWETISGENIVFTEDGKAVVAFNSLSPVAFAVAAKN